MTVVSFNECSRCQCCDNLACGAARYLAATSHRRHRRRVAVAHPSDGDFRAAAHQHRTQRAAPSSPPALAERRSLVRHGFDRTRYLQPRAVRRARVAAGRRKRGRAEHAHRPHHRASVGLLSQRRRHRHAHHGRADVDPADPSGNRADGLDQSQHPERHYRDHDRRNSARQPARPRDRVEPARAALCGSGARRRHKKLAHHGAAHTARIRSRR